jgi:RNA polymerase sigma-70 factor (ECF subfamily)
MAQRDPDVALMLRVRDADDAAAFAELVTRYQGRLVGVIHHLLGRAGEADDLAQEVFLRVYRTRKSYHPEAKFATWLFTIANNLALNALRSNRRRPLTLAARDSGPLGVQPAANRSPAPGTRLQQEELAGIIRSALENLSERQRMAVVLNKFEEMNYAEIAEVMGLTTKAVKSLLSRARAALRAALQAHLAADSTFLPFQPAASTNGKTQDE